MVATTRLRSLGRSVTPLGLPAIYLGWAYVFWLPIFGSEASVWAFPKVLFFLVGGASPLLAGGAMAYITGGKERVYNLWHRMVDVGRIAPKWWSIVIGFWLVFDLVMAGIAVLAGVSDRPITIDPELLTDPGAMGCCRSFFLSSKKLDFVATISTSCDVRFRSRRLHPGARPVHFVGTYGSSSPELDVQSGSLEEFLTERYRYYTEVQGGSLRYAAIDHEPWPLYEADLTIETNTLFEANGFAHPETEPVHCYSPGVTTIASPNRRV